MSNLRSVFWDNISDRYDNLYSSGWSRFEDAELEAWLDQTVSGFDRPTILDVGCGTGLAFFLLSKHLHSFRYVGCDISRKMLDVFSSKLGLSHGPPEVQLQVGQFSNVVPNLRKGSFDVIVMTNAAASYIGPPTLVLRDCRDLLSSHGRLFTSWLNRGSLRRLVHGRRSIIERFGTRGAANSNSVRAITVSKSELLARFLRTGFKIRSIYPQSVLGGVLETQWAIPAERALIQFLPDRAHTINIVAECI